MGAGNDPQYIVTGGFDTIVKNRFFFSFFRVDFFLFFFFSINSVILYRQNPSRKCYPIPHTEIGFNPLLEIIGKQLKEATRNEQEYNWGRSISKI